MIYPKQSQVQHDHAFLREMWQEIITYPMVFNLVLHTLLEVDTFRYTNTF